MGEVLTAIQDDWSGGVVNSLEADRLPSNSSPRAWNSQLEGVGTGKIAIRKRSGCLVGNRTPISGSPEVVGQYGYVTVSSGTTSMLHLLVSAGGRLDTLITGACAAADAGLPAPFTAGSYPVDFATANNLCFFANGYDLHKFNGTVVTNFGLARPTVGTMAGAAGAAGTPNGTYELRVTYANSSTGHESSASDTATATVTVASQRIDVSNIPTSADTQVDRRYIYVRNTSTMSAFYRAGTLSNNTATTLTLNFTDASLITQAPDTAENDPPPSDIRYLTWYKSRMFAASDDTLYYSQLELPESFDPDNYEPVNSNDGQRITGMVAAFECLLIFKTNSIFGLFGDPGSWELRQLVSDTGCESFRTICSVEGAVYWLSSKGLMRMPALGVVEALGQQLLSTTFSPEVVNIGEFHGACAAVDAVKNQVLLAVPELGQSRNTRLIPFNYKLNRFDSDKWDPFDIASMAVIADTTTGQPSVWMGNHGGQTFQWGAAALDGVTTGTTASGTITSSASTTKFSDSGATFDTTGAGLAQRAIIFTGPTGETIRRIIASNTGTELTVTVADTSVDVGWTYTIGSPDFQLDTPWLMVEPRFWKKRFKHAYALVDADTTLYIDVLTNLGTAVMAVLSFVATSGQTLWGTFTWGASTWGAAQPFYPTRQRIGRTGMAVRLRLRNSVPSKDVTVFAFGATGENKSDRIH